MSELNGYTVPEQIVRNVPKEASDLRLQMRAAIALSLPILTVQRAAILEWLKSEMSSTSKLARAAMRGTALSEIAALNLAIDFCERAIAQDRTTE